MGFHVSKRAFHPAPDQYTHRAAEGAWGQRLAAVSDKCLCSPWPLVTTTATQGQKARSIPARYCTATGRPREASAAAWILISSLPTVDSVLDPLLSSYSPWTVCSETCHWTTGFLSCALSSSSHLELLQLYISLVPQASVNKSFTRSRVDVFEKNLSMERNRLWSDSTSLENRGPSYGLSWAAS